MALTFRYHTPQGSSNNLKKPTIPIEFKLESGGYIEVMCLVDSGADNIVLPRGIAELINVKLSEDVFTSNGIGGSVEVRRGVAIFRIKKEHGYKNITAPVEVMNTDNIPVILGRKGFFDRFIITIDEFHQIVKLKEHQARQRVS